MVIPNVKTVGGFSICSPPHLFQESGQLLLAVKYSDHPPAKWIHKQVTVMSHRIVNVILISNIDISVAKWV